MRKPWHHAKDSRHARGYGTAWDKLRRVVMARDAQLCQVCKAAGRIELASEVDHIRPKAKGGLDDLENLQCICRACHEAKTARELSHRPTIGADGWPIE